MSCSMENDAEKRISHSGHMRGDIKVDSDIEIVATCHSKSETLI